MSDDPTDALASGVGAILGIGAVREVDEDMDAVRCKRIDERSITRVAQSFMNHQLSPLMVLASGIFFGIGWIANGGTAGKNGNQLDMIGTYSVAAGCLLLTFFAGSLRRVTRPLETAAQGKPGEAEINDQGAMDNPLSSDGGDVPSTKAPVAVDEVNASELSASATARKLKIHGSVPNLMASYKLQDYHDVDSVLAEGHLEDLGMGSVFISPSSSASLDRWSKLMTGISCFSLFASLVLLSIGIFRRQFLRWGSLGLFVGVTMPNLCAWWLMLKVASSLVADAVSLFKINSCSKLSFTPNL